MPANAQTTQNAQPAPANGYQLGHGYDLGPINLAGYSNVLANLPQHARPSLDVDDLSLFVSGHFGRLINPFMEGELTRYNLLGPSRSGTGDGDGDFVVERIYNDSHLTDTTTLRLGKMLSPVGEWNEIHAAPLVLSAVRPAVTVRNFSEYTTGGALLFSDPYGRFPEIQVYWQPSGELAERPSNVAFHHYRDVEGAHLSVPIGLLDQVGMSVQHSRDVNGFEQTLYGADYHYTIGRFTLQGEGTVSSISGGQIPVVRNTEWGAYAAISYALNDKWSVHGWYEGFADRAAPSIAHDLLAGVTFKPQPPIVFRLEYLQNVGGKPVNPTGLVASWSVLF